MAQLVLIPAIFLCLAAVGSPASVVEGTLVHEVLHSPALEGNLLGDSPDRSVTIYLPPGYEEHPDTRYPVVYLLHGITQTDRTFAESSRIRASADALIDGQAIYPMIVVIPNANNRYTGSQYVNSVVTGNWEDFIAEELVEYVDATYRTISDRTARGIAGYSMGGTGAMRPAMRHPDVYGAVYTMNASSLVFAEKWIARAKDRFLAANEAEKFSPLPQGSKNAISSSAAYSPNPDAQPFLADFPVNENGEVVEAVWQRWLEHDPFTMIATHRESLLQMRGLGFDCATKDNNLAAHRIFSQALTEAGVPHVHEEYEGGHGGYVERLRARALPFFSQYFSQGYAGIRVVIQSVSLTQNSMVVGQSLQAGTELRLAGPSDVTEEYPAMALDLSPLGLDQSVRMAPDGSGWYRGGLRVDPVAASGRYLLPLQVQQADGSWAAVSNWDVVQRLTLKVWPSGEVPVYVDAPAPGWEPGSRGLESLTLAQADVTHGVGAACAVQGKKSFAGWTVTFKPESPPNALGYTLRLALHPGDVVLSAGERFSLTPAPGSGVDLLADGRFDMAAKAWQVVEIPLEQLHSGGPLESINLSGNFAGTFYLDDLMLVAQDPPPQPVTAVAEDGTGVLPAAAVLEQNYPNPFNGQTVIRYALPEGREVELKVYNMAGQRVAMLARGWQPAGTHTITWGARDDRGGRLGSGVYVCQLHVAGQVAMRKLLLVE